MNKQMVNMLELAQPQPATPEQLMDCVRTAWAKGDRLVPAAPAPLPAAPAASTMYGTLYDGSKATADAKGTGGVKKCVLALACDYDDTLLRHNDVPATLDDWFEGLAKFCLHPKFLFKDPKKQQECWEQRVRLCGNHCKPRSTTPGSVVTYANSLAVLYKESSNSNKFIMSNKALFPKYNPPPNPTVHKVLGGGWGGCLAKGKKASVASPPERSEAYKWQALPPLLTISSHQKGEQTERSKP